MKKSLHIILLIAGIMMVLQASAKTNPQNDNPDKKLKTDLNKTFVLEGSVDPYIPDSCYNVYITDIGETITDEDLVTCVPVVNKQFTFTTTLDTMKKGRIRAIFPGNDLCEAWIDIYFIPGLTVFMTVHNGYFNINNQDQYKFMVNAWENEIPLSTLLTSMGASDSNSKNEELGDVYTVISLYKTVIDEYNEQIREIQHLAYLNPNEKKKQILSLTQKIEDINSKMEKIIEEYASKLKKNR